VRPMTARELKNQTGEVLRTLRRGEIILLTFRGRPVGTIVPYAAGKEGSAEVRTFEEAMNDLDHKLRTTRPRHRTWREAEDESRGRG